MIQINRETDYAVRCVYYLTGKRSEIIMVNEIAREMFIPKTFLAKILQKLARAGVVKSYQGVKGGFQISREPREISLYDVIVAIEGPASMNVCTINKKACGLSRSCKVHPFWVGVRRDVENVLKKIDFEKIRLS